MALCNDVIKKKNNNELDFEKTIFFHKKIIFHQNKRISVF